MMKSYIQCANLRKILEIQHYPSKKTQNNPTVLNFCSPSVLCLQTKLQSDAKKHIYVIYVMWRKIRNFAIQAISSENDRKIGRKYNGNIAGDFLRKTPL